VLASAIGGAKNAEGGAIILASPDARLKAALHEAKSERPLGGASCASTEPKLGLGPSRLRVNKQRPYTD
jgi:hypothetical protein